MYLRSFQEQVVESEGYTPKISEENGAILHNMYARYEATLENRLYRVIHELERSEQLVEVGVINPISSKK